MGRSGLKGSMKRTAIYIALALLFFALQPSRRVMHKLSFIQERTIDINVSIFQNATFNNIGLFGSDPERIDVTFMLVIETTRSGVREISLNDVIVGDPALAINHTNGADEMKLSQAAGNVVIYSMNAVIPNNAARFPSEVILSVCSSECAAVNVAGEFVIESVHQFGFKLLWNFSGV